MLAAELGGALISDLERRSKGEWKLVTILFADVANFTAISEKFDSKEVHEVKRRIKFVSIQNALADYGERLKNC